MLTSAMRCPMLTLVGILIRLALSCLPIGISVCKCVCVCIYVGDTVVSSIVKRGEGRFPWSMWEELPAALCWDTPCSHEHRSLDYTPQLTPAATTQGTAAVFMCPGQ